MSLVVSDTSPLRALAQLSLLDLLPRLFGEVILPPAVVAELSVERSGIPRVNIASHAFLRVQAPRNRGRVDSLLNELHAGESEAIALAIEIHPDFVLMDDREGREVAMRFGLVPVGAIGVLTRAKRVGLVPKVAPLLDRLVEEIEFRLSDEVRRRALEQAGE